MKKLQSLIFLLSVISIHAQQPPIKRVGSIQLIKNGKVHVMEAPKVAPHYNRVYKTWRVPAGETTGAGPVQYPEENPYIKNGKINVGEVVGAVRQKPMVAK